MGLSRTSMILTRWKRRCWTADGGRDGKGENPYWKPGGCMRVLQMEGGPFLQPVQLRGGGSESGRILQEGKGAHSDGEV